MEDLHLVLPVGVRSRSGPGPAGSKTKDLDLGYTLNLVCHPLANFQMTFRMTLRKTLRILGCIPEEDFGGDFEGIQGVFKRVFKRHLEGDSKGDFKLRSGSGPVWFSLKLKFNNLELDSKVHSMTCLQCTIVYTLMTF